GAGGRSGANLPKLPIENTPFQFQTTFLPPATPAKEKLVCKRAKNIGFGGGRNVTPVAPACARLFLLRNCAGRLPAAAPAGSFARLAGGVVAPKRSAARWRTPAE